MASGVAKRYAQAVFDLGKENGDLDAWLAAVGTLNALMSDPVIAEYLTSPGKSVDEKMHVLEQSLQGAPEGANRLARLLVQRGRMVVVPGINEALQEMSLEDQGLAIADVSTATELTAEQRAQVEEILASIVGKKVQLRTAVDPAIMGGIVAKVGDVLIDGSVSNQLRRMHERLTTAV